MMKDLKPTVIKSSGKEIKSFRIIPKETEKTQEEIKKAKRTNGLWIIISNTSSKVKRGLTADEVISAYRNKNQIEMAFKHVKSFINIPSTFGRLNMLKHTTQYAFFHIYYTTIVNRFERKRY